MIDSVQLVLLLVIVVLTSLLVVLGIQVFYILREFRSTIKKTNRVLDNANTITENIEGPVSALSSLALGVKGSSLFAIAKFVKSLLGKDRDSEERKRYRE